MCPGLEKVALYTWRLLRVRRAPQRADRTGFGRPNRCSGRAGRPKVRQRLRRRSGASGACCRALAVRFWRPNARRAAGWGGNRHPRLRRRRHVATFALTWRDYCLWRSASKESTFVGEAPRLSPGRTEPRACLVHQTRRAMPPPLRPAPGIHRGDEFGHGRQVSRVMLLCISPEPAGGPSPTGSFQVGRVLSRPLAPTQARDQFPIRPTTHQLCLMCPASGQPCAIVRLSS